MRFKFAAVKSAAGEGGNPVSVARRSGTSVTNREVVGRLRGGHQLHYVKHRPEEGDSTDAAAHNSSTSGTVRG